MHRLKELREERVWTQRDLADAAGVTQETVSRLERGENKPFPTTIRKLAKALGVEPVTLLRCGPPMAAEEGQS